MSIERIKQTDLTPAEREILKADRARWKRMGGGGHLQDWLDYFPGLDIRRRLAMKLAGTNKPEGKGYVLRFSELMQADGFDTQDKTLMGQMTAVLWLRDNPEHEAILRKILQTLSPGQRSRINTPISARQRVKAELDARTGNTRKGKQASKRAAEASAAHAEDLQAAYDLLKDENADLKRSLNEAKSGAVALPDDPVEVAKMLVSRDDDWFRQLVIARNSLRRTARAAAAKQSKADVARLKETGEYTPTEEPRPARARKPELAKEGRAAVKDLVARFTPSQRTAFKNALVALIKGDGGTLPDTAAVRFAKQVFDTYGAAFLAAVAAEEKRASTPRIKIKF